MTSPTHPILSKRFAPLVLFALAALLYLPRLGSVGLWDPSEVKVADAARVIADGKAPPHPTLVATVVAAGFKTLGTGELGGRLPLALLSILLVLAAYWAARAVLRPRAALLGGIALATTPAVLLGARQLTSQAPLLLGVTLAVGGLAHLSWPLPGTGVGSRLGAFVLALAGLALGVASGGLLHGVVAPLFAVGIALVVTKTGRLRGAGLLALGVVAAIVAYVAMRHLNVYDVKLAGAAHAPDWKVTLVSVLRPLGFATLPWFGLVPFALYHAFDDSQPTPSESPDDDRDRFCRMLLPAWLGTAYLAATVHDATIGELLAPAAPAIALLAGAYLDAFLERIDTTPLEALAVGAFIVVLGHDVLLTTEAYFQVLTTETIRWPAQLYWTSNAMFGGVALFGTFIAAALGASVLRSFATLLKHGWSSEVFRPVGEVPKHAQPDESVGDRTVYRPLPDIEPRLVWAAIGVQILFCVVLGQGIMSAASKHLSPKDLYGRTKQLDPKAALGQYRFNATGASYYMNGRTAVQLNSLDEVTKFLKQTDRVFLFVGSEELASIDQTCRQAASPAASPTDGIAAPLQPAVGTKYYVIDDSNSRFLILSNRLGPGESDLNPLRRLVATTAPKPRFPLVVNFDDKLKLIGYDLPPEVPRGADIKIRLYFEVLQPVGASWKVFIHLDGPGSRVNGDHVPLDGRFPTQFWTPGTWVTDEYTLKPDKAQEPNGQFQLYFGLFMGDKRMKVKEGPQDGENRVKLGSTLVK